MTIPAMVRREMHVLFASETGTTEDHAQELGRSLERLRFDTKLVEMDGMDLKRLSKTRLAVFMTSTTGQGEMPGNMHTFWKSLLRKKLPANYLSNLQFTTFGLGDSTYPKYNWAVKKLHKRLLQLGAHEFYPRGEGDEKSDEGVDGRLIPWSTDLCKVLLETWPLPEGVEAFGRNELLPPRWLVEVDATGVEVDTGTMEGRFGGFEAVVVKNERVTPETHFQDVRLLRFTTSIPTSHAPGDALSILPKNTPEVVSEFIEILGLDIDPDAPLHISINPAASKSSSASKIFPSLTTVRYVLTNYLDITAIPRRSFFAFISAFTTDETHKERLQEFTDPQYLDELYDYTTRPRRSILEVLQEFGTVKIPLDYLLDAIPRLRPRLFSIASSAQQHTGRELELLVAIVKYKTVIKKIRRGVCTRYISNLTLGDKLDVTISKGGLAMKTGEESLPVVMVGPGTGVAPMRALTWERKLSGAMAPSALFFGSRGQEVDYFFREEWEQLKEDGTFEFDVFTAFSRDQREKNYVQHQIRRQAALVYELLHKQRGIVYICGSSGRMPQAVREALIESFEEVGKMSRIEAEAELMEMEKGGRYRQETW